MARMATDALGHESVHNNDQPDGRETEHAPSGRKKKGPYLEEKPSRRRAVDAHGKYHAHVLLADDDPDMRRMIARSLRRSGYEVVEVEDGGKLLEHLGDELIASRYEQPDLVVSDIRMPGFSGLDVLAGLRRSNWAMPVVLITAFGDRQTHQEAKRLGAMLLDKPFELDELLHTVRSIIPPRF